MHSLQPLNISQPTAVSGPCSRGPLGANSTLDSNGDSTLSDPPSSSLRLIELANDGGAWLAIGTPIFCLSFLHHLLFPIIRHCPIGNSERLENLVEPGDILGVDHIAKHPSSQGRYLGV